MKQILKSFIVLIFVTTSFTTFAQDKSDAYQFKVNLTKVDNDKLLVELIVPKTVRNEKTVKYHIPKIVPGTYSIYNFGRFASEFTAYNKSGRAFKSKHIKHPDSNTWIIKKASKLHKISYIIEDTWDTNKDSKNSDDFIFEPGGTNIEVNKNFVINNHGFFGYFGGFKRRDYYVEFDKQERFFGATSLDRVGGDSDTDVFHAQNYMDLADAPIMYCEPDTTIVKVGNADVLISTYSPNNMVSSDFIASQVEPILQAQKEYLGGTLPVDKYAFIIYLNDGSSYSGKFGALEHSYSSLYYLPEMDPEQIAQTVRDVAAHEFFHIVTPLNIHSEEIHNFDYINPKMSMHLWLYEGVTEYSAGHVQVTQGLMPIESYLNVMAGKVRNAQTYEDNLPFTKMSSNVLTKHKDQYGNVYEKGALIGMCLDIRLRQLSNGDVGLQKVIQNLAAEFGKNKAFKDEELFEIITKLSYPEIGEFFERYVAGKDALPIADYLAEAGISYYPKKEVNDISLFGGDPNKFIGVDYSRMSFKIGSAAGLDAFGKDYIGFKEDDVIKLWNGEKLTFDNINEVLGKYAGTAKEGDDLSITVIRDGKDMELKTKITSIPVEKEHVILLSEDASEEQLRLRKAWLGDYKMKAEMK
ncbi:MAG: peptidase M61 [Saprospiraceae bacterium]